MQLLVFGQNGKSKNNFNQVMCLLSPFGDNRNQNKTWPRAHKQINLHFIVVRFGHTQKNKALFTIVIVYRSFVLQFGRNKTLNKASNQILKWQLQIHCSVEEFALVSVFLNFVI